MTTNSIPNQTVQPVPPNLQIGSVTPVNGTSDPSVLENEHARFSDAVKSRSPEKLNNLAIDNYGTATGNAAKSAADVLYRTSDEYNKLIKPIESTGGLASPEGRVKFAETYQTVKDKPFGERFMNYFVQTMSGNPKAYQELTGGNTKREIKYNDKGEAIEYHINELGEPSNAINLTTGQPVNKNELALAQSELANTIQRKNAIKTNEYNNAALLENTNITNAWASAAPILKDAYMEKENVMHQIKGLDLSPEQRAFIASFTSGQSGFTQSVTSGFNALNQINEAKGKHVDESVRKSATVYANLLGLTIQSDGSITDSQGSKVSSDKLKQLQDSYQKNNNYETNYSQTSQNLAKSQLFKNLGDKQHLLVEALEKDKQIEGKIHELTTKFGSPSFLVHPTGMSMEDPFKRAEAQALQGQFNMDLIKDYSQWREKQIKLYPPDQIPNPHELEIAFTKSSEFKKRQTEYSILSNELRQRKEENKKGSIGETPTQQVNNVTQATSPIAPVQRKEPIDKQALREKYRIKD